MAFGVRISYLPGKIRELVMTFMVHWPTRESIQMAEVARLNTTVDGFADMIQDG